MNKRKVEKERGEDGSILMNLVNIKQYCEEDHLYELPDLNSKLYLHFKGKNVHKITTRFQKDRKSLAEWL